MEKRGCLFAPGRHDGRAFEHRPFVVTGADHREAAIPAALPHGAEAVLRQLPRPLAPAAGADRLAFHLAVGRERHLEFQIRRRRGRKGLAAEEGALAERVGGDRRSRQQALDHAGVAEAAAELNAAAGDDDLAEVLEG